MILEIASAQLNDGVVFDESSIAVSRIREGDQYEGLRIQIPATVDRAKTRVAIDINFGDPVSSLTHTISYPCILSDNPFTISAYQIVDVLAEKLVTIISRGNTNTRDRDFGDVYSLIGTHTVVSSELFAAVTSVANYRKVQVEPIRDVLTTIAKERQSAWNRHRQQTSRRVQPENFADVVKTIAYFFDPLLSMTGRKTLGPPIPRVGFDIA